jgi:hypothetical protein
VVDRLRLFLNRPLSDADRPRLFAIAAALILAAAVVLAAIDGAGPAPERTRAIIPAATPADAAADIAVPPAPSPTPTAAPPSEEGTPPPGFEASPADVARAKRAARGFLADYLPYTYGRGRGGEISAATAELRRRLVRERPRVPARERGRRPRVVLLQSDGVSPDRGRLLALVRDGRRGYSVGLELARTDGRWRVTRVGA